MRWLVVGAAGAPHIKALRAIGEHEIQCVEPDPVKRRAVRDLTGKRWTIESWDDAGPYDVAIICSAPSEHLADVQRATGANIVVDAPLSLQSTDYAAMEAAIKRDRLGMVSCPLRFHPGLQALRARHEGGEYGMVYFANAWWSQALPDYDTGWQGSRARGGGLWFDRIHLLDVLRWAFGEPVLVRGATYASDYWPGSDVEASAHAVLQCPNAVVQVNVDSFGMGRLPEGELAKPGYVSLGIQFIGHKANLPPFVVPAQTPGGEDFAESVGLGWDLAHQRQAEHWRDAIAGKVDPTQVFFGGMLLVETIQAMYRSAEVQQGVKIDRQPPAAA